MQVFITKHNARKLADNLDKVDIDLNSEIFRIEFVWFGSHEIKELLVIKLLYERPNEFFEQYKKIQIIDTKKFVFEAKMPAYHVKSNCPGLTADYTNLIVPEEIRMRGDKVIEDFREWCKENIKLTDDGKDEIFYERMRLRFHLKNNPEKVKYANSGITGYESLELEELDLRIEKLISNANDFYLRSDKNTAILDHFGKISNIYKQKIPPNNNKTIYSITEIWEVLKDFELKYKNQIKYLLREYYRIKYNPELEFDGVLLEQLGFQKCGHCYGRINVDNFLNALNLK